ncbi:AlkA N-terminal domain-containing protein [Roseiterribacter gracilis]|uniref:AlkA N-terminal domain-containing protein n=1 Tax=Roseiterribacter gracilis TaxID=2812848 RepID=UPI003B437BA2
MDLLDRDACYRVIQSRDVRFDGRLFVGVTSTGIYCRPVCPARTPKLENCTFHGSATAAQAAGFRPCLRCRPETAPDLASWRGTSNSVSRALALIADGALDGDENGVEALAARLGLGERQLRRLFQQHLGASPVAVAQTRRVLFAKQLIQETRLPMAEVALASGFGSVRRFNETFQTLFRRPPSALRRGAASEQAGIDRDGITLRLRYQPPYDWESMLDFLGHRAIEGVEQVTHDRYRRTVLHDGKTGTVEVTHDPSHDAIRVKINFPDVRALPSIVARVRRVFDVGADIETISEHLARDPLLAKLVALRPGLRAPGAWDGFELAVRAVMGQQVSVVAARQLASKLVAMAGGTTSDGTNGLTRVFPTPEQVASADLAALGLPAPQRETLKSLTETALADPNLFRRVGSIEEAVERLSSIPGIGDWTAHYIALRALAETDAFPAGDVGLLRSAGVDTLERPTASDLLRRAETWRPWRAYAAQHLWAADPGVTQATHA